jgi:hypothetical protein
LELNNVDLAYYPETATDNTAGENLYKEIIKQHICLCSCREEVFQSD